MIWAQRKAIAVGAALQLAVIVAGSLPGSPAVAQTPEVERLFPAQPTGYVTDVAGIIEPAAAVRITDLIERLRGATGAEIAVVTLPSIGDREAAEVALAIGRRWGIGAKADIGDQRRNAGLVVLLVPRQENRPGSGHIRIEVGQGLEGIVPDAAASQIYRQVMGPDLARGAYSEAMLVGVQALVSMIARGYGVSDSVLTAYRPPAPSGRQLPGGLPLLPILFFITFAILANRNRRGRRRGIYWGGPGVGGFGGRSGGFGGGGFGGFGGGGGFSGGGSGGRF